MPRHPGGQRYLIELQAQPDDVPPHIRLKTWLKSALRAARMRAVRVAELPSAAADVAQAAAGGAEAAGGPSGENGRPAQA